MFKAKDRVELSEVGKKFRTDDFQNKRGIVVSQTGSVVKVNWEGVPMVCPHCAFTEDAEHLRKV